jgi:hypothetical protein
MPSKLWAVRAALVTTFSAGITDTTVFDGPMTRTTPPSSFLLVGTDGGDDSGGADEDGAVATQQLSSLGNNWRDEVGEVICAAWVWSGDTAFPALRTTAKAIVDVAEALVLADRTLGGVVVPPGFAEFTAWRLREVQTSKGAFVRASFTVSYSALIS